VRLGSSDAGRAFTARQARQIPWAFLPMWMAIEPADTFAAWLTHRLRPWRA
jgi:hypothetical protein